MDEFIDIQQRDIQQRQQLATPRMFGNNSDSEDSEDHLEQEAIQDELNNTGELETTLEADNPEEQHELP